MSLRCLKVSTLLLNSWITVKYGARQKLTRLTTQSQSLYIGRFIRHVQFTAVLLFGNNSSTRSAFVRKLSEVNEKPMIIIIISVCSQIITYKAVKANSWLQYWFPYLTIENRQAIWLWWRSECAHLYSYIVEDMSPCLRCRQFQHLFCSSELCCSGWFFYFFHYRSLWHSIDDNLLVQFASKADSLLIIYKAAF